MSIFDIYMIVILVLFFLVFFGRTLQLEMMGVHPLVIGTGKHGFSAFLEVSFLLGLLVWTFEIASQAMRLGLHIFADYFYRNLFTVFYLQIAGAVLIALGFLIFPAALLAFGKSWRVGIDRHAAGELVTNGVFSFSRNPIFVFINLYFWGTFLIYSNVFFLICALCVTVGIHYQILQEEEFLAEHHGQAYEEYRKKVRRYF